MAKILFYRRKNLLGSVGGVERSLVNLSNEFAKKGHDVYLTSYDKKGKKLFFDLNKNVRLYRFTKDFGPLRNVLFKALEQINALTYFSFLNQYIYRSKEIYYYCNKVKADVIIASAPQDLLDIFSYKNYNIPIILMLHGKPSLFFNKKRNNIYYQYLNKVQAIQFLMPSFAKEIQTNTRKEVIGNIVPFVAKAKKDHKNIIYVASVSKSKGQDFIINAFSEIAHKHPDWQVHFWGNISDKKYFNLCRKLIKSNNLEKQILFHGTTHNIQDEISKAKICVFGSIQEGFGLSLAESMSAGLAVLGRKDCSGVNELIIDGKNGLLADGINDFSYKMELLITDEKLRDQLGEEALQISNHYSAEKIIKSWEKLISDII